MEPLVVDVATTAAGSVEIVAVIVEEKEAQRNVAPVHAAVMIIMIIIRKVNVITRRNFILKMVF